MLAMRYLSTNNSRREPRSSVADDSFPSLAPNCEPYPSEAVSGDFPVARSLSGIGIIDSPAPTPHRKFRRFIFRSIPSRGSVLFAVVDRPFRNPLRRPTAIKDEWPSCTHLI